MSHKRQNLFLILAGFFITNTVLAELIGGKIFEWNLASLNIKLSVGVLIWPVVFIMTDIINEYFGKSGVRKLTLLTVGLIIFVFVALYFAGLTRAANFSTVNDQSFNNVFGTSRAIIIGSIIAFVVSQFVDLTVFNVLKKHTGAQKLWLRATGSTIISQLIDTYIVLYIAFVLPEKWTFEQYLNVAGSNYFYKLLIAVASTPIIYVVHYVIDLYLTAPEKSLKAKAPISFQLIEESIFKKVIEEAKQSPRKRKNYNYHKVPAENPHRFLNAMVKGTYCQPHRHINPPKHEAFVILKGRVKFFLFDDAGKIAHSEILNADGPVYGIDVAPGVWHTLAVLSPVAVCYEVKPGPYDADEKGFASWAPAEGERGADSYLESLLQNRA